MPIFTANIPGILKVGDKIEIGGKIKENARKMSVNLCAQEGEEPKDVVLHFDVRFHRDNIISLSRKNGIWIGSGNYDTNYNMFVPGTIFRIIFEIKDTDVITIYCQGKFHSNFLPKIPLTMAKYLVAWADVERITHCYFYMGGNKAVSGDETAAVASFVPAVSPRATVPSALGDTKKGKKVRKKQSPDAGPHQSDESSDDEKARPKADGRADRFFYDTLMCQPVEHPKFGSPEGKKFRREPSLVRCRADLSRRFKEHNSDTEKNDSDDYTEDGSRVNETSESEEVLEKRGRRGKFAPFAQVVNFMGKNARRN